MTGDHERDRLAERLSALPREAWDPPALPPPPFPGEASVRRRTLRVRPLVAAASAAVLLVLGVAGGLLLGGGDAGPGVRAGSSSEVRLSGLGPAPTATGRARVRSGQAAVRVAGLPRSRRGEFYELWVIGARGRLVSLGAFRVPRSGGATVQASLPVDIKRFPVVDVSLEKADGDPGHSGLSVLRGRS